MKLLKSPLDLINETESQQNVFWIGAISFEERCTGSITSLLNQNIGIRQAFALDYPTNLSPKSQGEQNRAHNRNKFKRLLTDKLHIRNINPYRYAEFVGELFRLSEKASASQIPYHIVIDISCLTKIHTIALAYWLLNRTDSIPVTLGYSRPEYYGSPSKNIWGKGKWITTILTRLDLDSMGTYSSSKVIAILGHEGDRLRLALHESNADSGLIVRVLPLEPMPSHLAIVSDVQNAWLFAEIEKGIRRKFEQKTIHLENITGFTEIIYDHCSAAKSAGSRVVLCPFGPKPFVFLSGYSALSVYREGTWLSYPIPSSYDIEYSKGFAYTLWFNPELPGNQLNLSM